MENLNLNELSKEELETLQKQVKTESKARKAGKIKEGFNKIKSSKVTKAVAGVGAVGLLALAGKKVLTKDKPQVEVISDTTHVVPEE